MVPHMAADTRNRILDALEKLLLANGVSQVTLENVAAEAGVSKGGLLYHFPTKEALLAGLVRRLGDRSDQELADAVAGGTTVTEFYLQIPDTTEKEEIPLFRSVIAALRTVDGQHDEIQNAVIDVMRSWDKGLQTEIADPVQAEIIRLVGDGLYLAAMLGLPQPAPELHRQVIERLTQ